jgi:hypothetical protein
MLGLMLRPACRDQRAFRLAGVNVDKSDMHPFEAFAAPHLDGTREPGAVGQVAAVPPDEGAGDRDILDRIVVAVAQRKADLRVRTEPAPVPGLPRELQPVRRRRLLGRDRLRSEGVIGYRSCDTGSSEGCTMAAAKVGVPPPVMPPREPDITSQVRPAAASAKDNKRSRALNSRALNSRARDASEDCSTPIRVQPNPLQPIRSDAMRSSPVLMTACS